MKFCSKLSNASSSSSSVVDGILEDVELSKITKTSYFQRSNAAERINDLKESIKRQGLLQPIVVRPSEYHDSEHYFEIVAGNRRYDACKSLGWRKILCHVMNLGYREAFEVSLIENIQRNALDPIDEAKALQQYVLNCGWGGISQLAARIGKSVSYIDKRIRLLNLPMDIIQAISSSSINPSTAEELLLIKDADQQSELASSIRNIQLTSREVRAIVKDIRHNEKLNANDTSSIYDYSDDINLGPIGTTEIDKEAQKAFDKAILILNLAMHKLGTVIEHVEDNWIIYEILLQHNRMLHNQIDLLIKEKKKM